MSELKVDKVSSRSGNYVALNTVGYKNIIINGDMSIAQRATTETGITSSGYDTIDRMFTINNSFGTWTQSQSTDVPTGQGFAKSLKMDCTTANASPSSAAQLQISQLIEGQNLQYLKKGTANAESLTLSFWVKSNKTGTYIAELFDQDNSRTISKSYTIDSASTWEKKTITFAGDTTGAFGNDNGNSLSLRLWLASGTDYTSGTLQTSWGSQNNTKRAEGQVNLADSTSNDWYITGLQLEAGTTASDFEFLPHDVNLRRCQRYCYRIDGDSSDQKTFGTGFVATTSQAQVMVFFPVTMRAEPTITESNIQIAYQATVADASLIGDTDESKNIGTLLIDADSGTPFTVGEGIRGRINTGSSNFVQFDAEL